MPFSVPTENQVLLASANSSVILTPRQKFDKYLKKIATSRHRMKKYHFLAIEHGNLLFLYNGLGEKLGKFDNDFHGKRECRSFACNLYLNNYQKENPIGGYTYDFVGE